MDTDARLKQIEQIAQNARTTWFGLLALLLFVGVTLMAHKDSDFFAHGAATTLPVINVDVPPSYFFYAAPILVVAIYSYLHIFLFNLWEALGSVEQDPDAAPVGDRTYPTLFTVAALWLRNRARRDGSQRPRVLGRWTVGLAILLGWGFGPLILFLCWWRSMPAHELAMTLVAAVALWAAISVGFMSLLTARHCLTGRGSGPAARISIVRIALGGALLVGLTVVSWGRVVGIDVEPLTARAASYWEGVETTWPGSRLARWTGWDAPPLRSDQIAEWSPLASARMAGAELTAKPRDWLVWDEWIKEYRARYAQREVIDKPFADWTPDQKSTFEAESWIRWKSLTASLDAPDLSGLDLRNADMPGTFLAGANLIRAQMEGADLIFAQMAGANLIRAQMAGANLSGAQMEGADLTGAQMAGAESGAQMAGADLIGAQMEGADLTGAQMEGADLTGAQMAGANLFRAQMVGADLSYAQMAGANLVGAQKEGADLTGAQMAETHCTSAAFLAALVQTADLTCRTGSLGQDQISLTVGDLRTVLPDGLWVLSCLDRDAPAVQAQMTEIEAAISHHPEKGNKLRISRAEFEERLFCDDGEVPHKTGSWPFERRFFDDFEGID